MSEDVQKTETLTRETSTVIEQQIIEHLRKNHRVG